MKTTDTVTADIQRYLQRGWQLDAADTEPGRWPRQFPAGTVTSTDADQSWPEVHAWSQRWHAWAKDHHVTLRTAERRIRGTSQALPTHVVINDADAAAAIAGEPWNSMLATGRARALTVRQRFRSAALDRIVELAASLSDVDFDLACTAAAWFLANPDTWSGLTPRQVPVEGLQGKWLNRHRALIETLANQAIQLADRPTRVHWTYLDPSYRATHGRRHDSLTLGDNVALPYQPRTVIIAENKDTAVLFPATPDAVCVEGNGNAAPGLLPTIAWIRDAERVIYWGDIDAAGYEILDRLRARIPHTVSMFMDQDTYERYERYGTNVDERNNPLKVRNPKPCPALQPHERLVYSNLVDPGWTRNRRVEQERIPLRDAAAHLEQLLDGH